MLIVWISIHLNMFSDKWNWVQQRDTRQSKASMSHGFGIALAIMYNAWEKCQNAKMARLPREFTHHFSKDSDKSFVTLRVLATCFIYTERNPIFPFPDRSQCGSKLYGLRPLLACLPAWWRFAQSLRRYSDTKQKFPHLANAGKYSTTFLVVFFSTVATTNKGIVIAASSFFFVLVDSMRVSTSRRWAISRE